MQLGLLALLLAVIIAATRVGDSGSDSVSSATTLAAGGASVQATSQPPAATQTPPPDPGVAGPTLWVGDVETGDTSQWRSVSISGDAAVEVQSDVTHSGDYALKLINYGVDGSNNAGVRMNFQGPLGPDPFNLPNEAYYSAWFYIPFAFEGESNIFQFKQDQTTDDGRSRVMLWKIALVWQPDGTYEVQFSTRIDQATGDWQPDVMRLGVAGENVRVGRWFHLETFYKWDRDGNGRTTVWLDGIEVWDQPNMYTWARNLEYSHRPREWTLNHYLGDYQGAVTPADSWIFVDDARVALERVGTNE